MQKAKHEQPQQHSYLDRMQAASLGVPEGEVRDQFTGFVVQVGLLFDRYGVQSEEDFLGIQWDKESFPDLDRYSALVDKLNEILDAMEVVVDDIEYRTDVSGYVDVVQVEMLEGEMVVVARGEDGSVLLNQHGEVLLESINDKTLKYHTKDGEWFAEATLSSDENILINSKGKIIAQHFREIKFVDWPGDIAFELDSSYGSCRHTTANGEWLVHPAEYKHFMTFADEGEVFHCYKNRKNHHTQLFNGKGEKVGKEYQSIGLLSVPQCWFVAFAKNSDGNSILVDREGGETPFDKEFQKVVAVGEKGARFYTDDDGYLFVYNEKAELVFGRRAVDGFILHAIKTTVQKGDKTFFIVEAKEIHARDKTEIILDENGEVVPFKFIDGEFVDADTINVGLVGREKVYYEVQKGLSTAVFDDEGELYIESEIGRIKVLEETEEGVCFSETYSDGSWRILNNDLISVFGGSKETKLKSIHQVAGRLFVITNDRVSDRIYESTNRDISLLKEGKIEVVQKGEVAYAIINPNGFHVQFLDLMKNDKAVLFSHIVSPPVVAGKNVLIAATQDFSDEVGLYDGSGYKYETPGKLHSIAPLGDAHIWLVFECDGVMNKKIFEI